MDNMVYEHSLSWCIECPIVNIHWGKSTKNSFFDSFDFGKIRNFFGSRKLRYFKILDHRKFKPGKTNHIQTMIKTSWTRALQAQ